MDDRPEDQEGSEPQAPQDSPEASPKLSAAFLPYDDERLWLSMPEGERNKSRPKKRRASHRATAKPEKKERDETAPPRVSRLSRPVSFGRRQIAALALTLALPVSAFAVTGALSGGSDLPTVPELSSEPTLAPSPAQIEIGGLRADRVSSKRVELSWDSPDEAATLTFTVYRDETVIAETTEPYFVDSQVEPQLYYYYSVATTLPDGTLASSLQLLVAVPSDSGQLPTQAPPSPSRVYYAASSPTLSKSPSPTLSKSPSPTKSKIVWPKTDFGSGSGGTAPAPDPVVDPCSGQYQSTDPALPCYIP